MPKRSNDRPLTLRHDRAVTRSRVPLGLISLDYGPWQDTLAAARRRRLPLVELYLDVGFTEQDLPAIEHDLAQGDVAISSVSSLARLAQVEDNVADTQALVERCIKSAEQLNAPFVTLMHGGCATLDPEAAMNRFRDRLAPLADLAGTAGVTLLIENVFSRQAPNDLDDVTRSVDAFERLADLGIGLNLDIGNYAVAGEEAVPLAWQRLRGYARSLHLKNVVPHRPDEHGPLGERRELNGVDRGLHVSVPLSAGIVNYIPVLDDLAAGVFDGPVMLEPFAGGTTRDLWVDQTLADLERHGVVTTTAS